MTRTHKIANHWRLDRDGTTIFSTRQHILLESIDRIGSINAAAMELGLSYRSAWNIINRLERELDVQLVQTQVGGPTGGGARLTEAAYSYLRKAVQFQQLLEETVNSHYQNF